MANDIKNLLKDGDKAMLEIEKQGFLNPKGSFKILKNLQDFVNDKTLNDILNFSRLSPSPDEALIHIEKIITKLDDHIREKFLQKEGNLKDLIFLAGSSPYLLNIMEKHIEYVEELFINNKKEILKTKEIYEKEIEDITKNITDKNEFNKVIRIYKKYEDLRIGMRDLLKITDTDTITNEISDLADTLLARALIFAKNNLIAKHGTPYYEDEEGNKKEAFFMILAMGKLGGRELNFSSDIDLIYFHTSDRGCTDGDREISSHEFFIKLARDVTSILNETTGEGFVYRVDLNLRPDGKNGPLSISLRGAENYYESFGQTWERSAMIKARPVAGNKELGKQFLQMIKPFVFRKYMDFRAIEEIKLMKEKINISLLKARPDTIDVKLGTGGIREIEFFAQALQLIYGGRQTNLRVKPTLEILKNLCSENLIKEKDCVILTENYLYLRDLEHRLQIIDFLQTQAIPARKEALEKLAKMMLFKATDETNIANEFWEDFLKRTGNVHLVFRSLFYNEEKGHFDDISKEIKFLLTKKDETIDDLQKRKEIIEKLKFSDIDDTLNKIDILKNGPRGLTQKSRLMMERISPYFLLKITESSTPEKALLNTINFLNKTGSRLLTYSTLYENPMLMDKLCLIFSTSEFLSNILIENVEGLDALLAKTIDKEEKTKNEILKEINIRIEKSDFFEEKLDTIRRYKNQEMFRIGINHVTNKITRTDASSQISNLALAFLEASIILAKEELKNKNLVENKDASFGIVAMGKLGEKEMNYGSDLDVVFLYSFKGKEEDSSLIHEYYIKLAQKIISILSSKTKEGMAFEVDARLRPSGHAGPLVIRDSTFIEHYEKRAKIWEKQSLTKSCFAAGDLSTVETTIVRAKTYIYKKLDNNEIDEIIRIRERMEREIAKEGKGIYNIKTGKGGLTDIEFIAQALCLHYGEDNINLWQVNTKECLSLLLQNNFLTEKEYNELNDSYEFLKELETSLRIINDKANAIIKEDSIELKSIAKKIIYKDIKDDKDIIKFLTLHRENVRRLFLKKLNEIRG